MQTNQQKQTKSLHTVLSCDAITCLNNRKQTQIQVENKDDQCEDYQHLYAVFKVYNKKDLPNIGRCLGYHAFLPTDAVLNLYQKYQKRQFGKVCQLCQQINIQGLLLNNNKITNIINQLAYTKFPYVHTLDLSNNNIQSLQLLSQVYLPMLSFLNLSSNNISNLKPLDRLYINDNNGLLGFIDLSHNRYYQINDMISAVQIQFDIKVIEKIKIYKVIITQKAIQMRGGGKLLYDYFR